MNRNLFAKFVGACVFVGGAICYPKFVNATAFDKAPIDHFDTLPFLKKLRSAKGDRERLEVYASRWAMLKPVIAHINVESHIEFHRSIRYWLVSAQADSRKSWTDYVEGDLKTPIVQEKSGSVLIKGDCLSNVKMYDNSLVHIYGDLNAELTVGNLSEIVIGGSVKPGGRIRAEGIVTVYVGGSVEGPLDFKGMSLLWVNRDLQGEVGTGAPSTAIYVIGNADAKISPTGKAALLKLDVHGFMPWSRLLETAEARYIDCQASIAFSDKEAGLHRALRGITGTWVVHNQSKGPK